MGHTGTRLLSYFGERVIASYNSPLNGRIDVSWVSGRKVLNSPDSNYSFGTLHNVFRKALEAEALKIIELSPVLILGLGAGSVSHILHKEWKYEVGITGVEKDALVLQAGREHFGLEENPLLEVIRADAMDYVGSCSTQFGLVVVDLFIGRMVPPQFETELFWSRLSRLVKRPGMVMFNKMVFDEQTRLQSAQLQEVARKSFEKVTVRRIRGPVENHVLIGEHLKD